MKNATGLFLPLMSIAKKKNNRGGTVHIFRRLAAIFISFICLTYFIMAGLPKPVNVSPLIKCARWSMLCLGITYGAQRRAVLEAYEKTARVKRNEQNRLQEEMEFRNMKISDNENMKELLGAFGVTVPPGWEI